MQPLYYLIFFFFPANRIWGGSNYTFWIIIGILQWNNDNDMMIIVYEAPFARIQRHLFNSGKEELYFEN